MRISKTIITIFILAIGCLNTANAQKNNLSDKKRVSLDTKELDIPHGYLKNLKWDLDLDTIGKNGSQISWLSDNGNYISNDGKLIKRSPRDHEKIKVTMQAIITSGKVQKSKSFEVFIASEEPVYDGYLFAYFEGSGEKYKQEQLRFGVSADGINWFALNDNKPIIPSEDISQTGGIRDPYIMRGEDSKTFYMVATDMFTHKNGWGANPGIVMLKSNDLINWNHGIIDLAKAYPDKFSNVQWVWAPQCIYDPTADKYLVYFTVRFKNDLKLDFYCAYANEDFTALESEPVMMFRAKYGAIDGDIIYEDGLYHFFFKGNTKDENGKEFENGIQQAIGKTLQGPWTEDFKYIDYYAKKPTVVEGSGIFKHNETGEYILMYDLYTNLRYEFQRSKDLFEFTNTPESFTKNFNPRHGTVMSITSDEAIKLNAKWGGVPMELLDK